MEILSVKKNFLGWVENLQAIENPLSALIL